MTQDIGEIRGLARDYAAAELRPHNERWDAAQALDDGVVAAVAELGFFGMYLAEADGGMGFDLATCLAAIEELAWGEPAVALLVAQNIAAADLIARHGDAALRARWLDALAGGEALAGIATVRDAPEALQVTRDGDGWRLRGSVRWVPGGDRAALAIVRAAVDGEPALFVVPRDGGFTTGERNATLGLRPVGFTALDLADVRVTAGSRLPAAGDDASPALAVAEFVTAAIAVGVAQAALEHAVAYAAEREQFGRPIREFEGVQGRLADMAARTVAARTLVERAAHAPADAILAAVAQLAAGDAAMHVTDDAVQVFGGYGYMRDYPVEKLMRDGQALPLLHGGADLQRGRIAEALYRE